MTQQEEITRRRTFAVIAHPDAGKTTLTEKLLLFGGILASNVREQPLGNGAREMGAKKGCEAERGWQSYAAAPVRFHPTFFFASSR